MSQARSKRPYKLGPLVRMGAVLAFRGYQPGGSGPLQPGQRVQVVGSPGRGGVLRPSIPRDGGLARGVIVQPLDRAGLPFGEPCHVWLSELGEPARRGRDSIGKGREPDPTAVPLSEPMRSLMAAHGPLVAAQAVYQAHEIGWYRLGGILCWVKEARLHGQLGYTGRTAWTDYVRDHFPHLSVRAAQFFISSYKAFQAAGWSEQDLMGLGWAKASELAKLAGTAAAEALLRDSKESLRQAAISTKREELRAYIRELMTAVQPSLAWVPSGAPGCALGHLGE